MNTSLPNTHHVRFGRTDLYVSRLCQGTAFRNIGRDAHNPAGEDVIRYCIDRGVNFFDTANRYGDGDSEICLGKAIAGRRDQLIILTKVSASHRPTEPDGPSRPATFSRDFLQQQLEESLQRLNTDYVDLFMLHKSDNGRSTPQEVAHAMTALVRAGKIRYWGVSNHQPSQVEAFTRLADDEPAEAISGTEDYFNIAGAEWTTNNHVARLPMMEQQMFPLLRASNLGLVAFSPMDTGLLAGGRRGDPLDPESPIHDLIHTIDQTAADLSVARAAVCIAWVLSHPEVTSVLSGAESPAHVDENLHGALMQLPPDALDKLNKANQRYRTRWQERRAQTSTEA